jgi:plasmid stability protein
MDLLWSSAMPNLSIKNVPEHVVEKLRLRAANHHRSLQGELMDMICRSTDEQLSENTVTDDDTDRESGSSGWMSISEVAAELSAHHPRSSRKVPLAVDIIRQERDSR